jgi:hypothetical protein
VNVSGRRHVMLQVDGTWVKVLGRRHVMLQRGRIRMNV